MGWEGRAEEGERGREGKGHIGTSFSHFKPWAVTG